MLGRQAAAGPCRDYKAAHCAPSSGIAFKPLGCGPQSNAWLKYTCKRVLHATAQPSDNSLNAEELAAYEEYLRQKKAAKQQALRDIRRKRKFNPLQTRMRISQQQHAEGEENASANDNILNVGSNDAIDVLLPSDAGITSHTASSATSETASSSSSSSTTGMHRTRSAARPRVAPIVLQRQQQLQQRQGAAFAPPASVAVSAAVARAATPAAAAAAAASAVQDPTQQDLAAMLSELLQDTNEIPEAEVVQQKAQRKRTSAQMKAAAAAKQALKQQVQKRLQQAAVDEAEGDDSKDTNQQGADDDDLDWDALGKYEALEGYLQNLNKEQQLGMQQQLKAVQAPLPQAAAAAAQDAAAVATKHLAKAPGADAAATTSEPVSASRQASDSASSGLSSSDSKVRPSSSNSSSSQFDHDLDELERFASLLEALESGKQQQQLLQQSARSPGSSSSDSSAASDQAGEALLQAFLGPDWEAELLDELAAVIDEDEEDDSAVTGTAAAGQQDLPQLHRLSTTSSGDVTSGNQQQQLAAQQTDDEQPWADEVTNLLLGLVTISHQKYLSSNLPLPNAELISEEERCEAFWTAPWALFVVDDSSGSCIEYVNFAASQMFGSSYLDLFGRSTHELVGSSLEAQSDWAYAVHQVEESSKYFAQLPQLKLQPVTGQCVLAKDITMWRVDSLEDTPIGMAVMVSSWEAL